MVMNLGQGLREKIFQGVRRSIPGPPSLIGDPCRLIIFCPMGYRSSFKSEGDNDIRLQLGPTKNTTRHKIGLNPARGFGGAL